jgi:hypothetical protein
MHIKPLITFFLYLVCITVHGQYISKVLEYKPAPGQFINKKPWGHPESVESIIGGMNGSLSLGAFGGYVVFQFENPVNNHPDNPFGVDFIIFGNPLPDFYEPGIVSVMKDENNNGLPDDTWYELAGSDYFFSSTIRDFEVTYFNPGNESSRDVPWNDNHGNKGVIPAGSFHLQPMYPDPLLFPSVDSANYTLTGTYITGNIDASQPAMTKSYKRAFGYADNQFRGTAPFTIPGNPYIAQVQNGGGDGFDISWAVDKDGNYVDLDEIHFIRVQTAMQGHAGWLGEISTEITGAITVDPNSSITGVTDLLVIKDLPNTITTNEYPLEAFFFRKGRVQWNEKITWSTDLEGSTVNEDGLLQLTQSGPLKVTAMIKDYPQIAATASTLVDLIDDDTNTTFEETSQIKIFPNPTHDFIYIEGLQQAAISIFDLQGRILQTIDNQNKEKPIDLRSLPSGIYFLHIVDGSSSQTFKIFKK